MYRFQCKNRLEIVGGSCKSLLQHTICNHWMKPLRWEVLISRPNNLCILLKKKNQMRWTPKKIIFSLCLRVASYYHIISLVYTGTIKHPPAPLLTLAKLYREMLTILLVITFQSLRKWAGCTSHPDLMSFTACHQYFSRDVYRIESIVSYQYYKTDTSIVSKWQINNTFNDDINKDRASLTQKWMIF